MEETTYDFGRHTIKYTPESQFYVTGREGGAEDSGAGLGLS